MTQYPTIPPDLKVPEGLFKDVKYYIIGNIDAKVKQYLNSGGAKQDTYMSQMVTHAIADDPTADDFSEAKELFELTVVSSNWVILSIRCGSLLPVNGFNPEVNQVFSGVVACPSQLSSIDSKRIWALIAFHGGRCQSQLNSQVTHLICPKNEGPKYDMAVQHPDNLAIVTPDWVTVCVEGKVKVGEERFHPRLLRGEEDEEEPTPEECVQQPMTPTMAQQLSPGGATQPPMIQSLPPTASLAGMECARSPRADSNRTKEVLARMVSNRLQGKITDGPDVGRGIRPLMALSTSPGGSRPSSPRTLRNITNNNPEARSPTRANKINQLVNTLSRPQQRQMSPGRSALTQQLQNLAASRAIQAQLQQEVAVYFGHDPVETVPEDVCLMGCVFYITDYHKTLEPIMIETWKKVIEQNGGQVDDSYSNRVTHLLAENQKSDVFQMALRDQKRVVTANWLNDCLLKRKMVPPWMALHFPSVYGPEKPCGKQIMCVSNFEGEDRTRLKAMIGSLGAKYTGYMTQANSVLVCKRPHGLKYNKAVEWRVPVVNVGWLNDLLLGNLEALKLPLHPRYQQYITEDEFRVEITKVAYLLEGWKQPLRIPRDAWKRFGPSNLLRQRNQENLAMKRRGGSQELPKSKRPRVDYGVSQMNGDGAPVVLMTGFPRTKVEHLSVQVEKLGGHIASSARGCTHLVAPSVSRTVKFLTALSIVKHIVTPDWLEQSALENKFLDETNFVLRDSKAELEYNFQLHESLRKARNRPLFKDLEFYLTPSVVPARAVLREIIANCGGAVLERRPSVRNIRNKKTEKGQPAFIVVTCEDDLMLCKDLQDRNVGVHNAEFILTGVMRQEVDYNTYQFR